MSALKNAVDAQARSNQELAGRAKELESALRVLVLTPHIHAYLKVMDPQAFRHATDALGYDPKLEPLPDLRDMMLLLEGLSLLHSKPVPATEQTPARGRQLRRLAELRNRLMTGLDPLIEREKLAAEAS